MRSGRVGRLRVLTRGAKWLLPFALAAIVANSAQAAPSTKYYTLAAHPTTSGTGETQTYSLTLTNCPATTSTPPTTCGTNTSTQGLGSANIKVPTDSHGNPFTLVASTFQVTAPTGLDWTTSCIGDGTTCGVAPNNVIMLRSVGSGDVLPPGQSLTVTIDAKAACSTGTYTWASAVKQSNTFNGHGNDFSRVGADPYVQVTGGGAVDHFGISLPSSPTPFTATAGTAFSPTVTAYDACGNPAALNGPAGSLTGNLGTASAPTPAGTQPSYGTVTFSNGVAMPSVTAYKAETNRTLTFSDTKYASVTTSTFTVNPGPPDHLGFTVQPNVAGSSSWVLNTNNSLTQFGTAVAIIDMWGNPTQSGNRKVSLTLNPPAGALSPLPSLGGVGSQGAPTNGVATFSGLTVDQSYVGYTLTASYATGVTSAISSPFNVYATLATCNGSCTTQNVNIGLSNEQATGNGNFLQIGIAGLGLGYIPTGCQTFSPINGNDLPVEVDDQRSALSGDLYAYDGANISDIQKKYSTTQGQQFIPICVGAMRIALGSDGKTYGVPCTRDYNGLSQAGTGWWGKVLDSTGAFVPYMFKRAVCDPGTGYFFGIVGSFQDYTAPKGDPTLDPSTNPSVTAWGTDPTGTYRVFTIRFPSSSATGLDPNTGSYEFPATQFAGIPWDGGYMH
jgi:hypothetical protein